MNTEHAHIDHAKFDVTAIRAQFPILATRSNGKPLVYLDNGATTQKPNSVIDAVSNYYKAQNSNIHRGVYQLSQLATDAYEASREIIRKFIGAKESAEIILTRGTTESINLVANSWSRAFLKPGDEIIISNLEHHSNIVPWQMACEQFGATLRVIPINDAGELMMDEFARLLSNRTKMVAVNHISNSLGTINPVEQIIAMAHQVGAHVLIDGAQWVAHHPTNVQKLDTDFYCFSGHKLYGPTGIGVLYGKRALLDQMPPYMGGGDMIRNVTFAKTTYADLPNKFEAGTPDIAGGIGLGAAIAFLNSVGFASIESYEAELLAYATSKISSIPGLRIIGTAANKSCVISFVMENPAISSFDLGTHLDTFGIAVRTGHHCCQPVMDRMKIPSTTRVSLAMYNTTAEIDFLVNILEKFIAGQNKSQYRARNEKLSPETELHFPKAAASTPDLAAADLIEVFDFLGDRDARNLYLMELAEKIPPMPAVLKTDANRVQGCMSTVHISGRAIAGPAPRLDFIGDSDAHIVRGLIAVLEKLFAGQKAEDILAFDIQQFFTRLGLEQFISAQRRNGLQGMISRIRELASKAKTS